MKRRFIIWFALIAVCGSAAWSIAYAQDENGCEAQCKQDHGQCVEYCSDHSNPMECDASCREDYLDCVHECRN